MQNIHNNGFSSHSVPVLIVEGDLHLALTQLLREAKALGNPDAANQAETLTEDYHLMLQCLASGSDDQMRREIYNQICQKAWSLYDVLTDSKEGYEPVTLDEGEDNLMDMLDRKPYGDRLLGRIFSQVVDAEVLHPEYRRRLHEAIMSSTLPVYVRATLQAAQALQLVRRFDAETIENLYLYTFDDQPIIIRQQALVTLVMAAQVHGERIMFYSRLRELYQLLCDTEENDLMKIQGTLILVPEAPHAQQRLTDFIDQTKKKSEEEDDDESTMKQGIQIVRDLIQSIIAGIDNGYNSFAPHSRDRFFRGRSNRHHWFMPFSTEYPPVRAMINKYPKFQLVLSLLINSVAQTDTDRFLTFFGFTELGEKAINDMSEQMEKSGFKNFESKVIEGVNCMHCFIHELYRYARLNPEGPLLDLEVFKRQLCMHDNPLFTDMVSKSDFLLRTAKLLISRNRYAEAISILRTLVDKDATEESLQLLIKAIIDYGHQNRYTPLLPGLLQRCNDLFPDNSWTLRHLADSYLEQGMPAAAKLTLLHALELKPDNASLLARLGSCYNRLDMPDKALEVLFQADLIKEGQRRTSRELAQAYLMQGNGAQAERYSRRVMSLDAPDTSDYLQAGHIALLCHDIPAALRHYMGCQSPDEASRGIQRDRSMLLRAGVDAETLQMTFLYLRSKANEQTLSENI